MAVNRGPQTTMDPGGVDTSGTGGGSSDDAANYGAPDLPGVNSAQGTQSGFNPLVPGVAAGVGILNWLSGQSTNDANSAEAANNRAFAAAEADTARRYDAEKTMWTSTHGYQNAVDDMKKAGLNPALMYAKGGSPEMGSGSGIQASSPGNAIMQNTVGQGLQSAMASIGLMNDLKSTQADIVMKQAQALSAAASAANSNSNARLTDEETAQLSSKRDATAAAAIRDAGDARWEDANRTARMLTTKAGIGSAIANSAKSVDDMITQLTGTPELGIVQKRMDEYRENKALNAAKDRGIDIEKYDRWGGLK